MNDHKTDPRRLPPEEFFRLRVEQDTVKTFEALSTGRYAEVMREHFHPDGVLFANWPPHLVPGGGEHRGLENAIGAMRLFFTEFEITGSAVEDIVIDRLHIAVHYQQRIRHIGTGRIGRVAGMNHWVVDADRRCVRFSIFLDNASLATIGEMIEEYVEINRGLEAARRRKRDEDPPA